MGERGKGKISNEYTEGERRLLTQYYHKSAEDYALLKGNSKLWLSSKERKRLSGTLSARKHAHTKTITRGICSQFN